MKEDRLPAEGHGLKGGEKDLGCLLIQRFEQASNQMTLSVAGCGRKDKFRLISDKRPILVHRPSEFVLRLLLCLLSGSPVHRGSNGADVYKVIQISCHAAVVPRRCAHRPVRQVRSALEVSVPGFPAAKTKRERVLALFPVVSLSASFRYQRRVHVRPGRTRRISRQRPRPAIHNCRVVERPISEEVKRGLRANFWSSFSRGLSMVAGRKCLANAIKQLARTSGLCGFLITNRAFVSHKFVLEFGSA